MKKISYLIICLSVIFTSCGHDNDDIFLKEVKVSKQPNKLSYYIGEKLDITGLEVMKVHSNGYSEVVKLSTTDFKGFDSSVANEKLTVYTIVEGKRIEFSIKIIQPVLVSLKIKSVPTKIKYTLGEKIDLSGLELLGEYSDGNQKQIEVTDKNIFGFDSDTPMNKQKIEIRIDKFTKSFEILILPIRVTNGVLVEFIGKSNELILPENIKSIAENVFRDNKTISKIVLNEGIESIGSRAFYSCSSLSSINFPSSLKNIEEGAFYHCKKLKTIDLRSTQLENIADNAFTSCSGLESLALPETLKTIGEQAFLMTGNINELKIPTSVLTVGKEAFRESGVQKVQINNGIETLETRCFYNCKSLVEVSIYGKSNNQGDICRIKDSSFERCSKLSKFAMPLSITHIGQSILLGTNITHLELGERVKAIAFSAFGYSKLTTVTIKAIDPPIADYYAFPKEITSIKVPTTSVDKYKKANFWGKFSNKITSTKN